MEEKQEEKQEGKKKRERNPRGAYTMWIIAGAYLVYLGYQLCMGVINDGENAMFMAAAIAFFAIGAGLVIIGIRNLLRLDKEKKEEEAKQAAEEEANGAAEAQAENMAPEMLVNKKPMSISERAHLVDKLSGEDPEETEEAVSEKTEEAVSKETEETVTEE